MYSIFTVSLSDSELFSSLSLISTKRISESSLKKEQTNSVSTNAPKVNAKTSNDIYFNYFILKSGGANLNISLDILVIK